MKSSFTVSSIVHLAFLAAIIIPAFHKASLPGTEIINVKLVAEERKAPGPVTKSAPPKKEQVVKKEEPVKSKMAYKPETKKPKPKPKKPEPKAESPSKDSAPSKSIPAAAKPGTSSKTGSGSKVRVDDKDFRFAYYLEIIKERISGNWSPPPAAGSPEGVISTVYFKISRDGRITDIKIEESSEFDLFDRSAMRAVSLSSPLPPLPAGFRGNWLGVHFEFEQKSG